MNSWPKDKLEKIAKTDDLHIAPLREDGVTYGTPTWIWSVVIGDELYVRPHNGPSSRWYKATMQQQRGRISAVGNTGRLTIRSMALIGQSIRPVRTFRPSSANRAVPPQ